MMLYSMTGFGSAQLEAEGMSFLVEIKSLNNRFLKTTVKLPEVLSFAEPEVERLIRHELARGSVTYALHLRHTADAGPVEINDAALQSYMKQLQQVLGRYDGKAALNIDLACLLQLPGICVAREYSEDEHKAFLEIIQKLTREALARLRAMRADEGKSLLADLEQQCQAIRENLAALGGMTGEVVDRYRRRIQQRVDMMLAEANLKLDQDLLIKEVAVFAERCDINEEISRLESHLSQFAEACRSDEQAGRRLDFLTQEMLREANTISSKANDARISQHVVEIKVAIDRLKEQVQNVE
jgi:uncharacterized protein (TIGR00255 family)